MTTTGSWTAGSCSTGDLMDGQPPTTTTRRVPGLGEDTDDDDDGLDEYGWCSTGDLVDYQLTTDHDSDECKDSGEDTDDDDDRVRCRLVLDGTSDGPNHPTTTTRTGGDCERTQTMTTTGSWTGAMLSHWDLELRQRHGPDSGQVPGLGRTRR